jgi:hypothetical protein
MGWIELVQDKDQWRASDSMTWGILKWLSDCRLLKKGSAPWS